MYRYQMRRNPMLDHLARGVGIACTFAVLGFGLNAQSRRAQPTPSVLDPTRNVSAPVLFSSFHTPLPEQYVWTRDEVSAENSTHSTQSGAHRYDFPGVDEKIEPHYFRASFDLASVPPEATLYIAGPRTMKLYVNGALADQDEADLSTRMTMHVFATAIAKYLHPGRNTLAIAAVRGRGKFAQTSSAIARQQSSGQTLAVKLVAAHPHADGPVLLISGPEWKSTLSAADGWEKPGFDDSNWRAVEALGPIESSIDLFQWNVDAGLYDWPGYEGVSPFLAHLYLPAEAVTEVYVGRNSIENSDSLKSASPMQDFVVHLTKPLVEDWQAPTVVLDAGREIAGRLEFVSDSDGDALVTVQYGESEQEMENDPFLGVNVLTVPAHGNAHGPKSAFRYARVRFVGSATNADGAAGAADLRFKTIHFEDIYYPVRYQGSFESSDAKLNRIWETGVYTAHLCMQDDLWDAPKRDRGRWMGDTDVSGRVIDSVFADHFLMEDTLTRLIGPAPVSQHVNRDPGFSSFWFMAAADYYQHTRAKDYIEGMHQRLVQLLDYMDRELDADGRFINRSGVWPFVDWAPDLYADTPETRNATQLEYYRAYVQGVALLRDLGDSGNADRFAKRAEQIRAAANQRILQPDGAYGPRWQTNAMAVISGVAGTTEYDAIWSKVLSHVGEQSYLDNIITPHYGEYVLDAMATMGHRREAMQWIRQYWGGMIDEGATSFWEAYDPSWPKANFHSSLQADGVTGYFSSLAHGWSAGPSYWLMEQVLGIVPTAAGFSRVSIRPDLVDLDWARGTEPTPNGLLMIDIRNQHGLQVKLDLPPGVEAHVSMPISGVSASVFVNGKAQSGTDAENGVRRVVTLGQPGHYTLTSN